MREKPLRSYICELVLAGYDVRFWPGDRAGQIKVGVLKDGRRVGILCSDGDLLFCLQRARENFESRESTNPYGKECDEQAEVVLETGTPAVLLDEVPRCR